MRLGRSAVVVLLCASVGCSHWRALPTDSLRGGTVDLRLREVRVEADGESSELTVHRVAWPYLEGWDAARNRERRVDLERAPRLSVRAPDHLLSALLVGGAYAVIATLSFLALAASSPAIFGQ